MAMIKPGLVGIFNNTYTVIEHGGLHGILGTTLGSVQNWEEVFTAWSQPPGKTEEERCDRAERMIKQAIETDHTLQTKTIRTFSQGSYRNRTNVRQDSDVDVCVLCEDAFFYDLPAGVSESSIGIVPANYHFDSYKNDVERALISKFGRGSVWRGNKAFDVNKNTGRVDADVAPCFAYRRYVSERKYYDGTALIAGDTGQRITNFPQQQYDNGVAKNNANGRRFKKAVRIVKKLSNEMEDSGVLAARAMTSFLIESLIWNVPDELFGIHSSDSLWSSSLTILGSSQSLHGMMLTILTYLHDRTRDDCLGGVECLNWTEENGIKPLFPSSRLQSRTQVNQFLHDALNYIQNG